MPGQAARHLLNPHPTSVGIARRVVRNLLEQVRRPDLVESAQLLVSEIVTNALVHAGTPIEMRASAGEGGLRVEVADGSSRMPARRAYGALAGTGRGLQLVEELADRWGALPHEQGKTVWFEMASGSPPGTSAPAPPDDAATVPPTAPRPDVVHVVLLNVPLLLHAAWQQHAEELLREYLLVTLEADDATDELENHAAASSAMSLLHEHVPAPDVGDDPEALMASALDPGMSLDLLALPLSRTAVRHFRVLDERLESALTLADSGRLLTAPIQPELRALRRWICKEVERQSRGEPPVPWSFDPSAGPPGPPAPSWEEHVPDLTPGDLVAADDTDRIVAVGQDVCDLLGYQGQDDLLGRRLVAIIPPRYHQAHLAGFTLHLSTGRSPLLGRPVVVPALRSDGTEVRVELTVRPLQLSGTRRLFVARIRPVEPALPTAPVDRR